jgi:hypothetical protein
MELEESTRHAQAFSARRRPRGQEAWENVGFEEVRKGDPAWRYMGLE